MLGRVKEAVSDAAETLRRAFAGLAVVDVAPEPFHPRSRRSGAIGAEPRQGLEPPMAASRRARLLQEAVESRAIEPLRAELRAESGWARWRVEADVARMAPLEAGQAGRATVPPLPRSVRVLARVPGSVNVTARRLSDPLPRPGIRRMDPAFAEAVAGSGLATILSLDTPIQSEDIQRLPKGLWMRYSLQLVRGTGENVRNLEVLGLFRIPRKGVTDLRHDPKLGRILLRLEPSAASLARAPFILARRKDDGALVSCFVEDP